MKAASYAGKGKVQIKNYPKPALNARQGAIIKTIGCGLCGSDIVKIKKDLVPTGTILGHEVVGIVEEINKSNSKSIKQGDRVVVAHHVPCDNCRYCLQGSYSMCENFKKSNLEPGGFAEYIYISESHIEKAAFKVPDEMEDIKASFMEPLGCILRALDRANICAGQTVFVIGLGFIGLLFVQLLKKSNTYVLACDLIEERVQIAKKLGADSSFNSADMEESVSIVNKCINFKGVDVVILASGANKSLELAMETVRDGGKIIIFASVPDDYLGFRNNDIYYRELSIIGAYSSSPEFLAQSMNMLTTETINLEEFSDIMSIEEINEAIESIIKHKRMKVYLKL